MLKNNILKKYNVIFNNDITKLNNFEKIIKTYSEYVINNNNNLTSLEGCPTYIGMTFWCHNNTNLWSMDHFPRHAKGVHLDDTPIFDVFNLFFQ